MNITVRAEELGIELRRLRESSGLSLELAGECIGASATKMSRIERGLREGSIEDISGLLAVYRCTGGKRDELLRLAHDIERLGWWQRTKPDVAERQSTLMNLEDKADLIVTFDIINMPGRCRRASTCSPSCASVVSFPRPRSTVESSRGCGARQFSSGTHRRS